MEFGLRPLRDDFMGQRGRKPTVETLWNSCVSSTRWVSLFVRLCWLSFVLFFFSEVLWRLLGALNSDASVCSTFLIGWAHSLFVVWQVHHGILIHLKWKASICLWLLWHRMSCYIPKFSSTPFCHFIIACKALSSCYTALTCQPFISALMAVCCL